MRWKVGRNKGIFSATDKKIAKRYWKKSWREITITVDVNKLFQTHRYTCTAFVHCNWLYQIARQCISPLIKRRWLFSIKSGPFKFFIASIYKISDFFQNVFCCKYHFNCSILFQIWFDMRRYFLSLIKKTKSILLLIVF